MLNIINERSNHVYTILSTGKPMRFLAIGQAKTGSADAESLVGAGQEATENERYHDAQLEVRLGPDALHKKLLTIAREAQRQRRRLA